MNFHPGFTRSCVALPLALLLAACGDDPGQQRAERAQLASALAETDSLRAANQVLETRLEAARIAARTAGTRLANRDRQLASALQQARSLKRSDAALRDALHGAHANVIRLEGELSGATRALEAEGARNAELARRLGALSGWLGQRSAHGQSQDVALKALESELEQSRREQATLRLRAEGLNEDLQKSIATAMRLETSNASLSASEQRLRQTLAAAQDALEKQAAEASQVQRDLAARLSSAEQLGAELRGSNDQLKARVQAMREELSAANDRADGFRRAKEYLGQKVEVTIAETATLGERIGALRDARDEAARLLVSQRAELSAALAGSEKAHEVAGARINALEAEVARLETAVKRETDRTAEAAASAEAASKARDYLEGKLAGVQQELEGIRDRSRSRVARLEQALHLSVEEARLLGTRMQEAEATSARAMERQRALEQSVGELESALAEARRLPEELNTRIRVLEQELARAQGVINDLRARISELQATIDTQKRDGDALSRPLEQAIARRKELETSVNALEERLTEARGITRGLNSRITELEAAVGTLRQDNTGLAAKLEDADRQQASCASARKSDEAAMRDLKWGNDTLIREIASMESRVRELEASSGNCELRRTAL